MSWNCCKCPCANMMEYLICNMSLKSLIGRPFVKWFALCYQTVVCLSVLSCPVCLSCLWHWCTVAKRSRGLLVVNCWQEVTNFLFPVRVNCIVTIVPNVTITIEIRMKNQKFLTKYDYILNMQNIIKYNNKLDFRLTPSTIYYQLLPDK